MPIDQSRCCIFPQVDDPHQNKLPPDVPISSSGFCLLGVPLGSDTFRKQIVLGRVEKIHLRVLGDSQMSLSAKIQLLTSDMSTFSDPQCNRPI